MSTTRDVDLGGVHVTGSWNSPGGLVEAQLAVYTKSGQARIALVDERQLIQLIEQAATALQQLRVHRELTSAPAVCPCDDCARLAGRT